MTEEPVALDLDWELAFHLGDETSVLVLQKEQIRPDIIEDPKVREMYEWQMEHVREHTYPATPRVLEEQFPGWDNIEPDTAINDLIARLRERYIRNEGRHRLRNLADLAVQDPHELAKELSRYGRELTDITTKRGEVYSTGDFNRAWKAYEEEAARGMGPSLGFKELDDHFNGQIGVSFLIAAPKTYKSWVTVNTVMANIERGLHCVLYPLELPALQTEWRLRCMAADVPYWKYLKHCLSPTDEARLKEASKYLDDQGLYRIEKPNQGDRGVARMVERAINIGADCVFIDQLQYIENRKGGTIGALNNTGDYFEVVNDLRNYSDEIPIFVVHQFNRSVMGAKGMPEMQQGKGSSAIEEVATLSLGIWADKDMRRENEIEIGTLASRNYSYASWRVGVQLSGGCGLDLKYRVGEDDENDE